MAGRLWVALFRRSQWQWRVLFVLYTFLLVGLSLMHPPKPEVLPPLFPHADKLAHFLAYAGYGVLTAGAFLRRNRWCWRSAFLVVGYGLIFGLGMEVWQALGTGYRSASWGDAAANGAGMLCAVVFVRQTVWDRLAPAAD